MTDLLIVTSILILGFGIIIILLNRKLHTTQKSAADPAMLEWLRSMQVSLESTNKSINSALSSSSNDMVRTLQENSKQLNERLDKTAQVIAGVGKEVGQMSEIGRSMR